MPLRFRPLLALGALVLALSLAAPVAAQNAPTLGAPETQTETAAPPPETTSTGGGGLETWQQALIFAAGVILLGGIAFAILGDARERTRKFSHHTGEEVAAGVPHQHSQAAKQRARAKARQARRQRRKNR
jgi:TRAP-type C4-dicarboxylate transport system permease small subunit